MIGHLTFAMATALTMITTALAQQPAPTDAKATARVMSGKLECRTLSDNQPCGSDTWTMTVQTDGTRTLRSMTEQPGYGLQINIVLRVDPNFRPLDAFTQTYSGGAFLGAGFFAVNGGELTASVKTPERQSIETIPVPEKFSMLLHPVSADGWHFGSYDKAKGGVQEAPRCAVGAARESVRCALSQTALEFVAAERITTPAGIFDTDRFKFGKSTEVWLAGPDRTMVRHEYRAMGSRYELTEIKGYP